ncbi:hypothetical protein [Serratia nevei]|uniref:hypothetical protein n=1 Tax=Serratia nevei TaxID=2703794 RepID=UPI00313CFD9E
MVQRYNPDYVMHAARFEPFARENEHGEFVKFSDYEALVSELASIRQINAQTLQVKLTMAEAIKELTARVNALAVENAALNESLDSICNAYNEEMTDLLDIAVKMAVKLQTPATDAALAAIQAQAKAEAIEQLAIQLEQLPDDAFDVLSDAAEFETYQEEHHTFVSISNPRAVANAVLSLVKEQSTELREAK